MTLLQLFCHPFLIIRFGHFVAPRRKIVVGRLRVALVKSALVIAVRALHVDLEAKLALGQLRALKHIAEFGRANFRVRLVCVLKFRVAEVGCLHVEFQSVVRRELFAADRTFHAALVLNALPASPARARKLLRLTLDFIKVIQ